MSNVPLDTSTDSLLKTILDAVTDRQIAPVRRLLLTTEEAARVLAISERSLWTLAKRGTIARVRVGQTYRYAVSELERYVDEYRERANCFDENQES